MAEIQATGVAVAPAFDVVGPAVTAPATIHQRDLFGRQNNYDSCGYYSFSNSGWATWQCGEPNAWTTTCKTIGSHFGCFQNIYTTCYPSTSSCNTNDQRALCCNENASFPHCATGIKTLEDGDGEELSIYLCGKTEQQVPFYESTVVRFTTGSTTEEQTLTNVDTTRAIIYVTKTAKPDPEPEVKSSTPVGAIVGGVVGGVALIAILGLAFWFLRRKKQNKQVATAPAAPAPGFPPEQQQQQQQQQMGYQQGVPPPVFYDYNNNNYAGYPVQGSPPPPSDPRYSQMPVGGMVSPPLAQSPPIEPYKTVASPVSELPVSSPPHENAPVSELPADMGNASHTTPR
ncbi:hypothetical protein N0V84_001666 [Fusarium piperis]|uniref:Uncharacterized protein n=1 Tax=Fusarium piperis TaxID=1435070 RepID=A0A9W8WKM6_9HYPO|nr:hypothetical protein N0V84_001666 [Fusarium piperis]